MIKLSNGQSVKYVVASGALAFSGRGWFWERPLVWLGLIRPELFAVVIKSLTRQPVKGYLRWWKPWTCVRLIPGGSVNKIGLTNKGIEWWCKKVGPKINYKKYKIVGSIFGIKEELVEMAEMLNKFPLVALEINVSCPNKVHEEATTAIVESVKAVKAVSRHPIWIKVSVDQQYFQIAEALVSVAEAMSFNSVRWDILYGKRKSPLHRLEKRVGGGGGGVSGTPAQAYNWPAVSAVRFGTQMPVIFPSVMNEEDVQAAWELRANAVSFGAIHLRTPWKPTQIVKKERL